MCDHHFPGKVCIPDPAHVAPDGTGVPVISMDANNGDVFIGGPPGGFGHRGRLVLTNADGDLTYEIDGETGTTSQSGDIVLLDADGNERVRISGQTAEVIIRSAAGDQIVHLDGKTGDFTVGGNGQDGDLIVKDGANASTIRLDGDTGNVTAGGTLTGQNLVANGATTTQDLTVNGSATIQDLTVNGATTTQDLTVNGATTAQDLTVNGVTTTKDITVTNAVGNPTIEVDGSAGDITLGGGGVDGDVIVRDAAGNERIRLDGDTGDIRLQGADCAEEFDVAGLDGIDPGTVLVIDNDALLRPCAEAYDRKVAGVVSGASGTTPGIILGRQPSPTNTLPIALNGKVFCKVDARAVPVEVGDLLTTSPVRGHAMKAEDPSRAFGAVIGKALRGLESGQGLIPILVSLQ